MDDAAATFEDYAGAVLAALPERADDLVLVGHSLGAMALPIVASRRPIQLMVFLCAVIPNFHGMPWEDVPAMGQDDYGTVRDDDGALRFDSLEAATAIFYADCSPADATWAFDRLRPVRNASLWDRPYPLSARPDVPVTAVTCVDDRAIYADYQRAALRDRFGVEPVELPGHHSPFLAQPARLAATLESLV